MRFLCRSLSISYAVNGTRAEILRDVSLGAEPGEFVAVVGPSGCGKTTLLRTVAGFLKPQSGWIEHHSGAGRSLMVYQENSLFPWMTVLENACFGLEAEGVPRPEREARALPLLRRFSLEGREHTWPYQLSAGMKQRVAVIRGFLSSSDLLLMDEPFAALDRPMRLTLQQELLELWEQDHKTVLFVTHDVDEAILLADRVVVMSALPGTIAAEFPIPFRRPREAALALTGEFVELKREIYRNLHLPSPLPSAERAYAG